MNIFFLILLLLTWLVLLGLSISMLYRRKTVDLEELTVYRNYLYTIYPAMLATMGFLYIVERNIDLIHSWTGGNSLTSDDIVFFTFILVLIVPMSILFFIIREKEES
jgi:hypothetical protein